MPPFSLVVQALRPPTLPPVTEHHPTDVRSPLLASVASATSPLYISISLPSARDTKNPLYPATHLQLAYHYEGTGEIYIPNQITPERLRWSGLESDAYEIEVSPEDIARAKVNEGTTSTASVILYAWKGEKLLGKWTVGQIEGLGIEGMKSTPLALLRQKTWKAM